MIKQIEKVKNGAIIKFEGRQIEKKKRKLE